LEAGTIDDIIASKYIVASGTEGALQIAPDNRIYVAMRGSGNLSRINQPNEIGADCGFEYGTISLGGRTCSWGLPPFIQSFFSFNAGFYNDKPCLGVPTQFYENSSQEPDSVLWNFGDAGSGDDNTSTEFDPLHLFSGTGLYPVRLIVWIEGIEIEVSHLVIVGNKPPVDLGADTSFCSGETYTLDAGPDFDTYEWGTGEDTRTITVDETGTYWVTVTVDENCSNSDTVTVVFHDNPISEAGSNQLIEIGTTTNLEGGASSGAPPYAYFWSPEAQLVQSDIPNPETVPLFTPQEYNLYVTDANNCVSEYDNVLVNVYEPGEDLAAFAWIDKDTICYGEQVNVSANATGGEPGYDFTWTSTNTGFTSNSSDFSDTPAVSTTYELSVEDSEGSIFLASVSIVVHQLPEVDLIPAGFDLYGPDTIRVCVRDSVMLDAGTDDDPLGTVYSWEPSNLYDRYLLAKTSGSWIDFQTHGVEVTNGLSGCSNAGEITIFFDFNECAIGIEEEADEQIEVVGIQPNPNNGTFNLEFNEVVENAELSIMDIRGQMIFNKKFNRSIQKGEVLNFNIDFPEKGLYFVSFKSDTKHFASKLIVR